MTGARRRRPSVAFIGDGPAGNMPAVARIHSKLPSSDAGTQGGEPLGSRRCDAGRGTARRDVRAAVMERGEESRAGNRVHA